MYKVYSQRTPLKFSVYSKRECDSFCRKEVTMKGICHAENEECFNVVFPLCLRNCIVYVRYNIKGQRSLEKANMINLNMFLDRKKNYQKVRNFYDNQIYDTMQDVAMNYQRDRIQDGIYLTEEKLYKTFNKEYKKILKRIKRMQEEEEKKVLDYYSDVKNYREKPQSKLNVFNLDVEI